MPGRVLNFSEFFGKYSADTKSEKNLDDFTQSSSNFEEGFDDATYDQTQLGPNRPVSNGGEMPPAQPGETGTPKFSASVDASMNAPEEQEVPEETEETKEVEEPAEEQKEEPAEKTDVPEPEAGANPKKEKMEESLRFKGLKDFSQFINEQYDEFEEEYEDDYDLEDEGEYEDFEEEEEYEEYGMNPEDMMDDEMCPNCGVEIGYSPEGASCGCNM